MSVARSSAIVFAILIGWATSAKADDPIASTPAPEADKTADATAVTETAATTDAGTKGGLEDETITIPLESIWSNAGRGTKSLHSLEPELIIYRDTPEKIKKYSTPEGLAEFRYKAKQSLVLQIERALQKLPLAKDTNKPKPGFAVEGIGRKALVGVHDVLVMNKGPQKSFPARAEISVVFFSHPSGARVALDRIERQDNVIRVHYMLISHGLLYISSSLALIPLGQLSPGEYRVEMVRSADQELQRNQSGFPSVEANAEQQIICRPFEFTIKEKKDENRQATARDN